jgi:hypothetical protein
MGLVLQIDGSTNDFHLSSVLKLVEQVSTTEDELTKNVDTIDQCQSVSGKK